MPQFLVAIQLPDTYDTAAEDDALRRDISALNAEMVAAGIRKFVGGLEPARAAKTIRRGPDGGLLTTDGPFAEAKEHVGGFWVLDLPNRDEALAWGQKAATACRASVEVRQFN